MIATYPQDLRGSAARIPDMPKPKPRVQARVLITFTESQGRHKAQITVRAGGRAVSWNNNRPVSSRVSRLDALRKAVAEIERAANSIRGAGPIGVAALAYFRDPEKFVSPTP